MSQNASALASRVCGEVHGSPVICHLFQLITTLGNSEKTQVCGAQAVLQVTEVYAEKTTSVKLDFTFQEQDIIETCQPSEKKSLCAGDELQEIGNSFIREG